MSRESDLLARLNALKPSTISLQKDTGPKQTQKSADLVARIAAFDQRPSGSATPQCDIDRPQGENEDDKTLEDLLADIGPSDQWNIGGDDANDMHKLMKEAKASLKEVQSKTIVLPEASSHEDTDEHTEGNNIEETLKIATDLTKEAHDEVESSLRDAAELQYDLQRKKDMAEENDDADADVALQRILDELSLESALVDQDLVARGSEDKPTARRGSSLNETHDEVSEAAFDLPSAPSTAPLSRVEDSEDSRFRLPSAPTSKPSKKVIKSSKPAYEEEDIETWCVICNDDATVLCKGCEGDIYCASCWKEIHTGPNADVEERTHRWTKYMRPSKAV